MITLFIITVKGCPEYKLVPDEFIYNYENSEEFRQQMNDHAKSELKQDKFEFEIIACGPPLLVIDRHKDYFVSQN